MSEITPIEAALHYADKHDARTWHDEHFRVLAAEVRRLSERVVKFETSQRECERTTAAILLAAGGKVVVPEKLLDVNILVEREDDKIGNILTFRAKIDEETTEYLTQVRTIDPLASFRVTTEQERSTSCS
jgi:hypothetical protein